MHYKIELAVLTPTGLCRGLADYDSAPLLSLFAARHTCMSVSPSVCLVLSVCPYVCLSVSDLLEIKTAM